MGMASSQARLLMLTSRLHDIEYKAQNIQNAKIQLSTQEDEVYEAYQKALDATTLTMTVLNGANKETIPATFNSVFGISGERPASISKGEGYILLDSRGRVVVDDDVYEGYHEFMASNLPQNAYAFGMYMLYGNGEGSLEGDEWDDFLEVANDVFEANEDSDPTLSKLYNEAIYGAGYTGGNNGGAGGGNGGGIHVPVNSSVVAANTFITDDKGAGGDEPKPNSSTADEPEQLARNINTEKPKNEEYKKLKTDSEDKSSQNQYDDVQIDPNTPLERVLRSTHTEEVNAFLNYFFSHYGELIYNNESLPEGDIYNFNYYVRIYNAIQQHGGCISINDFSGPDGDAATDADWLTAMVESGQLSIEKVAIDQNGQAAFKAVGVSSDTNFNYTTTSTIDKAALARAEAKYEHDLKIINKKDDKYDRELKKLETERTALTKEYDSIKKVSDDNIERTFGIFS